MLSQLLRRGPALGAGEFDLNVDSEPLSRVPQVSILRPGRPRASINKGLTVRRELPPHRGHRPPKPPTTASESVTASATTLARLKRAGDLPGATRAILVGNHRDDFEWEVAAIRIS